MRFETNRDPNYFQDNRYHTNCGSFAFNICDWYGPDGSFDEDDTTLAVELADEYDMSDIDILETLFERNVEQIHLDFDVIDVDKDYKPKEGEDLVAFRMCVNRTFYDDELIVDYHFRVKRNGKWLEKCGSGPVKEVVNYNEEPWLISEELIYWGPIAYFVKK